MGYRSAAGPGMGMSRGHTKILAQLSARVRRTRPLNVVLLLCLALVGWGYWDKTQRLEEARQGGALQAREACEPATDVPVATSSKARLEAYDASSSFVPVKDGAWPETQHLEGIAGYSGSPLLHHCPILT